MCCICYGTLTPENTLVDDLHEGRGGVHKGKCAYLAGIVPPVHQAQSDKLIRHIHSHRPNSQPRRLATNRYYAWIDSVCGEDHYDMSGPE